jgi:hypothetical protein
MFPYTFEAVTAITITVLSIIITLYVLVLKRKGWLKEETSPESPLYLRPNPESKTNFQKPTKSTALSETRPREHSACPHCGTILTASPSKIQKKPKLAVGTPLSQEKPKITIEDLLARKNHLKRTEEPMVPAGNQETRTSIKSAEIPEEPTVAVGTPKPLENSHEYEALEHLKAKPLPTQQVKASEAPKEEELPTTSKNAEARPQECPHYFGYLRTTPKDSAMPEECFCCPKIMECFYSKVVPE